MLQCSGEMVAYCTTEYVISVFSSWQFDRLIILNSKYGTRVLPSGALQGVQFIQAGRVYLRLRNRPD